MKLPEREIMFKYHYNWEIDVYKPNKAKGLWRYYVVRVYNHTKQYLSTGGWTEDSMRVEGFRTEEEAILFGETMAGERITKIPVTS